MKFNLEIGGSEGELKELIEILQQLAKKPHIQSAVETNELENKVYMANDERRKAELKEDLTVYAVPQSLPPEPKPKKEEAKTAEEPKKEEPKAEESKKEYTCAEVSKKAREFMDSFKDAKGNIDKNKGIMTFKKILGSLGCESVSDVPKEKYPELIEALNAE